MRYFIFIILCVFSTSCGLFNRHTLVKETDSIPKPAVLVETKYFMDSATVASIVADTNPPTAYVFDVSSYLYLTGAYPSSGPYMVTGFDFSKLILTPAMVSSIVVDSLLIQHHDHLLDTNSVAQVKVIPKSSAKSLPEPKSALMPYIATGITTAFLAILFFLWIKRKKKNIQQ